MKWLMTHRLQWLHAGGLPKPHQQQPFAHAPKSNLDSRIHVQYSTATDGSKHKVFETRQGGAMSSNPLRKPRGSIAVTLRRPPPIACTAWLARPLCSCRSTPGGEREPGLSSPNCQPFSSPFSCAVRSAKRAGGGQPTLHMAARVRVPGLETRNYKHSLLVSCFR